MSEKIEPALSAKEWREQEFVDERGNGLSLDDRKNIPDALMMLTNDGIAGFLTNIPATIALANEALQPDDRRKITPQKVRLLREFLAGWLKDHEVAARIGSNSPTKVQREAYRLVTELADALESYLPPEA